MRLVWRSCNINVGHGSLGRGGKMPDIGGGEVYDKLKAYEKREGIA